MTDLFRPGQRWVSVSEPELGLAEVRGVGPRTVTLAFPATGDTREYVRADPPLRRAAFRVGDRVATTDHRELIVERVRDVDGLLHYEGAGISVCETSLSPTLGFSHPLTRLFAGAFDPPDVFDFRATALTHQHRIRHSPVRGFVGGRVDLLPHQLGIAAEVTGRLLPRVLLADEVGLGKTIEAGLILHRLLVTGRVSRILILVPPSLVHQWFVEFLRRFNLWFSIFDEERCRAILTARPEVNPFLDSQLVLTELGLLTGTPERLDQAIEAGWDAVVVDEAHHLGWTPDAASPEYAAVEALGQQAPSLLLLTATPEQLGVTSHFARLRLLDPDRFHNLDAFIRESAGYRDVARVAEQLGASAPLSPADRERLEVLLRAANIPAIDTMARIETGDPGAIAAAIDTLLDQHGTGRVMFRNTRASVAGFPDRVPHLYPLEIAHRGHGATQALRREWAADRTGDICGRQPNLRSDPRVDWLLSLLKTIGRANKVLLLCRSQSKALAIEAALRHRWAALQMAAFHEGLTLIQRDRNAAWFADPDGARLLICSEIGSEGRNFQFAHHLVLFDLPPDPALLEQRLGRLDRIGQTERIHIHVPYVIGSHQEVLARWYHDGLDAFAEQLPGARELLDLFESEVHQLAEQIHDRRHASGRALEQLVANTRAARHLVERRLEQGRDKLLEWNSFRPKAAAQLIARIRQEDEDRCLDDFLLGLLDLLVIQVEELAPRTYRLGSAGVLVDDLPGLPADGLTVTADRRRALAREELQFLTWDHPLVTGALDLLLGSERGNCSVLRWVDGDRLELYLEAVCMIECIAPSSLQVDRFLPPTPVRIVVDHRGRHVDVTVPRAPTGGHHAEHARAGGALLARGDIREAILPRMVQGALDLAAVQIHPLVERARQDMGGQLDREIARLRDLQKVNRSVRDTEIEALVRQRSSLDAHLGAARLRLDAVRLIHRGPQR